MYKRQGVKGYNDGGYQASQEWREGDRKGRYLIERDKR